MMQSSKEFEEFKAKIEAERLPRIEARIKQAKTLLEIINAQHLTFAQLISELWIDLHNPERVGPASVADIYQLQRDLATITLKATIMEQNLIDR